MAPRANWKGFLRLSLVTCPVALYPATSESEKISFNQLNRQTGHRIKYLKVDADTGEEVANEDIVKGYLPFAQSGGQHRSISSAGLRARLVPVELRGMRNFLALGEQAALQARKLNGSVGDVATVNVDLFAVRADLDRSAAQRFLGIFEQRVDDILARKHENVASMKSIVADSSIQVRWGGRRAAASTSVRRVLKEVRRHVAR